MDDVVELTILGTSDVHSNILGFSYEDNRMLYNSGFSKIASYVEELRKENKNLILLDAGDSIQGSIISDDIAAKELDIEHPVVRAMNLIKYDAICPGNHEFNWGVSALKRIMSYSTTPIVCQNVKNKDGSLLFGRGWIIIERAGVRVAIIGTVTNSIPIWDQAKEGITDLIYQEAYLAVHDALDEIGSKADIFIVIAHMGLDGEFAISKEGDSAKKIFTYNPRVDAILAGHKHKRVYVQDDLRVIGAPDSFGKDLCQFDFVIKNKRIISSKLTFVDLSKQADSTMISNDELILRAHKKAIELASGKTAVLGVCNGSFQPENEIRGIPEYKLRDTALVDLINNIVLKEANADVSAICCFKDTSALHSGKIYYANIFDIYKFDNTIYRVRVSGRELINYLEWTYEAYNTFHEGDINISFDKNYPGYLLDFFQGISFDINLSKKKGSRIENVLFKGRELRDDDEIALAVTNYRYSSALKALNIVSADYEWESSLSIRDYIVAYLKENSPITPFCDNNWRIVGVNIDKNDSRRKEIIRLINEGRLEVPYYKAYNLKDYDELIKKGKDAT